MNAIASTLPFSRPRATATTVHLGFRIVSVVVIALAMCFAAWRGFGTSVPVALAGLVAGLVAIVTVFRGEDRRFLLTLFLGSFALRVVASLVLHPYIVTISRDKQGLVTGTWIGFLFEDDRAYHKTSWALARVWLGQLEGVASSDAYLLRNYTYLVGGIYYAIYPFISDAGNQERLNSILVMAPKMLNSSIGALAPAAMFALGRELGGRNVGTLAAIASAAWPSLLLWSVINLKDILVVLLIAVIMCCAFRFARRPGLAIGVLMIAAFAAIENLRLYVFYAFGWLVPLTFFMVNRSPWKRRLAVGFGLWTAILAVMLLMNQGTQWLGLRYLTDKRMEALYSSRDFGSDTAESGIDLADKINKAEGGWSVQIRNIPVVLPYVLLAPFPWAARTARQFAVMPEMLGWYAVELLSLVGVVVLARHRWRELFLLTAFVGGLVLIFSLIEGNVGTIFRHRAMLMPAMFTLAALGMCWFADRWTARRAGQRQVVAAR